MERLEGVEWLGQQVVVGYLVVASLAPSLSGSRPGSFPRLISAGRAPVSGRLRCATRGSCIRPATDYMGLGQTTRTTTKVRGPWTPSTRDSSMSDVAEGPLTHVSAARGSRADKASGTDSTICSRRTTTT